MRSWRTSLAGILLIAGTIFTGASALLDNKPETTINFDASAAAIVAGLALLSARDNRVSSEDVGIK